MNLPKAHPRGAIGLALGVTLLLSVAAPAAAADPARPFLGSDRGTSTIGPPIAACPAGSMFFVEEHDTGNFTHLGRVHSTMTHCAALDFATGAGWTTQPGSMTIIAANGDRLYLSYDATFQATPMPIPTTAVAHIDWVVTGGTGRFAAATGSGSASLTVNYTPDLSGASSSSVWSGTIAY
jgi:hypothetical protein